VTVLGDAVANPFIVLWNSFMNTAPGVLAAIVVILLGFVVAHLVYALLVKLFEKAKLDKWLVEKTRLHKTIGDMKISHLLAVMMRWFIFVLFLPPAATLLKLDMLSVFLLDVAYWIPKLIIAVVILIGGLIVANYVAEKMHETKAKSIGIFAEIAKFIIIIAVAIMALDQIGVNVRLAENSFLIILAGIMLALAIAFGLGMKEEAGDIVKRLKKRL